MAGIDVPVSATTPVAVSLSFSVMDTVVASVV